MSLNLQTLSLRSRDQDSDDGFSEQSFAEDSEAEDGWWKTAVDREIYVDGVKVGGIVAGVVRREEMGEGERGEWAREDGGPGWRARADQTLSLAWWGEKQGSES